MRKTFLTKGIAMFVAMTMLITTNMMFVSCSQPDDGNDEEVENPEDNLPDAARAFVGYWVSDSYASGTRVIVFNPDGTCWTTDPFEKNYWTYNESTMILATTIKEYQWLITLSNSEVWTGIDVDYNKARTFHKASDISYISYVIRKCWNRWWRDVEDIYGLNFSFGSDEILIYSENHINIGAGWASKELRFVIEEYKDFVFTGYIWGYASYSESAKLPQTISIKNPYDPAEISIEMNGHLNVTLYPNK